MASIFYTTDNLIAEIRSLLDEENVDSISDENDILPAINRAQDFAFDIYARKYPEPILEHSTLDLIADQAEYDIPEDVFEDRILKLEVNVPSGSATRSSYLEMLRISYRDLSNYESASVSAIPWYYCIIGKKIRVIPTPAGIYDARMWYLRNPEKLVTSQGRVTLINTVGNYVIVDSSGSSLTTESDQLGSYVNWIDGQSGLIKATLQIQSLNENKITFRTVPTRTIVLNRTVTGSLPTDGSADDYLCAVEGICVPYYGRPTNNFLIKFSVAQLVGKLGGNEAQEEELLKKFEQQVERTWVGREKQMRVQKRSQAFGVPTRRWFYS